MKRKKYKIDKTDKKILSILQAGSKITNARLSQLIGLSAAPTLERVRRLEKNSIIRSYRARLNREALGFQIMTFVMVSLTNHDKRTRDSFLRAVKDTLEIVDCYHLAGTADFLLRVVSQDAASYEACMVGFLEKVKDGIHTQSLTVLSTVKEGNECSLS